MQFNNNGQPKTPTSSCAPQAGLNGGRELSAIEEKLFRKKQCRTRIIGLSLMLLLPLFLGVLIEGTSAPAERQEETTVAGIPGFYTFLGARLHGPAVGLPEGKPSWRGRFANGQRHGFFEYYDAGVLVKSGRYYKGQPDGKWVYYKPDGSISEKHYKRSDKLCASSGHNEG